MAYSQVVVKVPDLTKAYAYRAGSRTVAYSDASVKRANIDMIKRIWSQYSTSIIKYARIFEIPNAIIVGFIATESNGTMAPPNRFKATGLMQATPAAVYDTITKWKSNTKTDIPVEIVNSLKSKLPTILNTRPPSLSSVEPSILRLLQFDTDFNIMMGTMILRWILEFHSYSVLGFGKKSPLNKTLVAYNAGVYRDILKVQPSAISDSTFLATSSRVPLESRGYLYKMLGIDGFLALIYIDLARQNYII